jgi:hypothetical protein
MITRIVRNRKYLIEKLESTVWLFHDPNLMKWVSRAFITKVDSARDVEKLWVIARHYPGGSVETPVTN